MTIGMWIMLVSLLLLYLALCGLATSALVRTQRYSPEQIRLQLAFIWLAPFIGALLVWSLARDAAHRHAETADEADGLSADEWDFGGTGADSHNDPQ